MPRKLDAVKNMKELVFVLFVVIFSLTGCAEVVTPLDMTMISADARAVDGAISETSPVPSADASSQADVQQAAEDAVLSDGGVEASADVAEPRGQAMLQMLPLSTDAFVSGAVSQVHRVLVYSSGRPIGLKKIMFGIEPILGWNRPDYRAQIEETQIFLGSTELGETDGSFRRVPFSQHGCGALGEPCSDGGVVNFGNITSFTFARELVIDRAGIILTFAARVTTPQTGDYLNVHFFGSAQSTYGGRQTEGFLSPPTMENGVVLFTGASSCNGELRWANYGEPDQESLVDARFLWSDRTALNHNDRDCRNGGSRDWFNASASPPEPAGGYSLMRRIYQR